MIKNIVFDLGNVILNGKACSVLNNMDLNELEKKDIKNKFFDDANLLDLGLENLNEHFDKCNLNKKYKNKLINYYKYRNYNKDVLNLIDRLKQNNYRIYILSDNNYEVYNYLKNLDLFNNIDGWIISCEYGITKPNPKIYETLFKHYNLNPFECYFVDDKEENIIAGEQLGMKGHVLNYSDFGISKLEEDLKNNLMR